MEGDIDLSPYLWPDVSQGRIPFNAKGVDWSNPITAKLVNAFIGGVDVVSGKATLSGTSPIINVLGIGTSVNATTYVDLTNTIGSIGPITFICLFVYKGFDAGGFGNLVSYADICTLRASNGGSNFVPTFYSYNGSSYDSISISPASTYVVGTPYFLACVHTGSVNTIYAHVGSFLNANPLLTASVSAAARSSGVSTVRLGQDGSSRGLTCDNTLCLVFNRAILPNEMAQIYAAPGAIFL